MPNIVKIRVLIVDDIAETRENIRRLLQFEGDMDVVGAARTGREAVDLALETKPDVVLMDINMPDMDGIAATEAIRKKVPFSQIIILSVQGDPRYMREAMLAGARDFLSKPPMVDELTAAIRRAGVMAQDEKVKNAAVSAQETATQTRAHAGRPLVHGKIIVVYSPKGGAGSTTIATNLAINLVSPETKVALVDGDLQFGDITVLLNEQGKNTILDLAPRADELDPDIIDEVLITHTASGIQLLPAPSRPEQADKVTGDQFSKLLQYLRSLFHYVIVDTSCTLTDVVLSGIDIADMIILITTQEIPAVKNARAFLSLLDGMRISRKRILFVMNKYDKRIAITPEKICESLKQEVVAVLPMDDKVVLNSINRGVPFMLDNNKTQPVGRSIQALGDLVKERAAKSEMPEQERVGKR